MQCNDGQINVIANELTITVSPNGDTYTSSYQFKDGSILNMSGDSVSVGQKGEKETIGVNVASNEICSCFEGEEVVVTEGKAEYKRKGKMVDAREDE